MGRAVRVHEKWCRLVQELGIDLGSPVSRVTARQIKRRTGEEPRIMAKMDTRESLPSCFQERGVFVLPTSNGEYVIVKGDGYHDLEPIQRPIQVFARVFPFELVSATV